MRVPIIIIIKKKKKVNTKRYWYLTTVLNFDSKSELFPGVAGF